MTSWDELGISIPSGASGPEVHLTCPKCSHERRKKSAKCLSANIAEGVWNCFHCGWSGSLQGGVDKHERAWQKPKWVRPVERPPSPLSNTAYDWLTGRGITREVIERNQIGVESVYMPQLEEHADAIVFPYYRNGELINRKYRSRGKSFRMESGAERILWNLDSVDPECMVIVEGEMDCLAVQVAGITSCVSVPDGAPAENTKDYSSKFTFLDADSVKLDAVKKIVIAVDNDAPGKRLEDELARRFGRERCWQVTWPHGCKDANDVLLHYGADTLRVIIENAKPYPLDGVFTALGESDKVLSLYRNGFERGHKTGWRTLDPYYTVRPGEFTVVTGIPSSGKSGWVDALMVNLAREHGWSFGIFSPENQPIADHMARMVEKYVGEPFSEGPTQRMSEGDMQFGLEWVDEHFYWLLPNDDAHWEISWILQRATELVRRHGIRGLVIDPWNELEPQRTGGETETEYVSRVLRTIRQWGRRNGVHIWLVVHPTKLRRDDDGKYPVPTLYDCQGSSHFRSKADNGISIHRDQSPDAPKEVDVHVQKIRFRQVGRIGKVTLRYNHVTATYDEYRSDEDARRYAGGD